MADISNEDEWIQEAIERDLIGTVKMLGKKYRIYG